MKRLATAIGCFFTACVLFSAAASARTWNVYVDGSGDVPTIQAAIDSAAPGDEILVGAGRYTWTNQGTGTPYGLIRFLRGRDDFTLRSVSGAAQTILDAQRQGRVVYLQGYNNVTIEGFTITGGDAPLFGNNDGGGIIGHLSPDLIKDCVITGNNARMGGGVWFGGWCTTRFEGCVIFGNTADRGAGFTFVNSGTTIVLDDCIVRNNTASDRGGGGMVYSSEFRLENTVIAYNRADSKGGGLHLDQIHPSSVAYCTISQNAAPSGGGIHFFTNSDLTMTNSIVCHGTQGAAFVFDNGGSLNLSCSNVYGNAGGDALPPEVIDSGGNFSLDPEFCGAPATYNYELQADSPCAPGNHPDGDSCGQIGAKPPTCGSAPVEVRTWGQIKSMFRD